MQPLALSQLASDQARWLVARQKIVAENVANSDTPGYRAKDLRSFSEALEQTKLTMATTSPQHMNDARGGEFAAAVKPEGGSWDVVHSGNNVSLEQQMLKANEINRAYSLNAAITKAFSRMLATSVKG